MAAPPDAPASLSPSLVEAVLARLAETPDPQRALRLFDWLLRLSPDALAALERQAEAEGAAPDHSAAP
jgi:hypothetical protein